VANATEPQKPARSRTRTGKRAPSDAAKPETNAPSEASSEEPTLAPDALARALRAVANELERDPALAQRVTDAMTGSATPPMAPTAPVSPMAGEHTTSPDGYAFDEDTSHTAHTAHTTAGKPHTARAFRPRLVTGAPPELGTGIPDPFALRKRLGKDGLRAALAELRLGSLRAIVREYALDPGGKVGKLNDAEKLRALILAATN